MNRELWGDDDIFVAVDVYAVDNPKKRILCVPYAPPFTGVSYTLSDDKITLSAFCTFDCFQHTCL